MSIYFFLSTPPVYCPPSPSLPAFLGGLKVFICLFVWWLFFVCFIFLEHISPPPCWLIGFYLLFLFLIVIIVFVICIFNLSQPTLNINISLKNLVTTPPTLFYCYTVYPYYNTFLNNSLNIHSFV